MTWITTSEAAALLGVTSIRVRQLIAEGRLKAKKFARDWMVDQKSVARFERLPRGPKSSKPKP
jgi:excisionase family DNA binding protein